METVGHHSQEDIQPPSLVKGRLFARPKATDRSGLEHEPEWSLQQLKFNHLPMKTEKTKLKGHPWETISCKRLDSC